MFGGISVNAKQRMQSKNNARPRVWSEQFITTCRFRLVLHSFGIALAFAAHV